MEIENKARKGETKLYSKFYVLSTFHPGIYKLGDALCIDLWHIYLFITDESEKNPNFLD